MVIASTKIQSGGNVHWRAAWPEVPEKAQAFHRLNRAGDVAVQRRQNGAWQMGSEIGGRPSSSVGRRAQFRPVGQRAYARYLPARCGLQADERSWCSQHFAGGFGLPFHHTCSAKDGCNSTCSTAGGRINVSLSLTSRCCVRIATSGAAWSGSGRTAHRGQQVLEITVNGPVPPRSLSRPDK